jgi:site-specific DNA-methyltransferase (adenine-specific)
LKTVYSAKNSDLRGKVVCGDAIEFLRRLRAESARVVFLDPPFNLGKRYDKKQDLDRKPEQEYRNWLLQVASESIRVLEPGGALFVYHIPSWAMRLGSRLDEQLTFRQWIAVSMKNGFVRGNQLYPAHYALLMFAKGKLRKFVRPKISPAECRTCGELLKDYGGYKSIIQRKGINLSDIWGDISPVRHASTKTRAANELPELLFHRIFKMVGAKGALYVDPFAGSGSGVLAAIKRGMRFAACDIVADNCGLIAYRIKTYRRLRTDTRKRRSTLENLKKSPSGIRTKT